MTLYSRAEVWKQPGDWFMHHLQRRDSWWVEAGEYGLIYFTDIIPHHAASLNLIWWDGKLPKERAEWVKYCIFRACELFDLQRISVSTTPPQRRLNIFLQERVGMQYEGTMRQGYALPDGTRHDLSFFSLLREEVAEWQLSTISSVLS